MWPFTKKRGPKPTGRVYNQWEHQGWGDRIGIWDWEKCKLDGHLPFYLQVGDEIRFKMQSGRVGRGLITEVKQMSDPHDMFFATFYPLGYLDEVGISK